MFCITNGEPEFVDPDTGEVTETTLEQVVKDLIERVERLEERLQGLIEVNGFWDGS